jgi:uncharacterized repeat protein (TIGR03803 family)
MRKSSTQHAVNNSAFLITVMLSLMLAVNARSAPTVRVLHNFGVVAGDGNLPSGPLLKDAAGNLYGMTSVGGAHNVGTVYRLSPTTTGEFKETLLYSFKGGSADGGFPQGPLFQDSAGNLYGVTLVGGINATVCGGTGAAIPGCGIVFKLSPTTSGTWTETVLHRFAGSDGGNSYCGLVRDSAGNFYGATSVGGSSGLGTVYKLSLTSTGWNETVLHSFAGGTDGNQPLMFQTTLALDGHGNIYGSTYYGGTASEGTVFELIPESSGAYAEKILHSFQGGAAGANPLTGVTLDQSGNVYGGVLKGGTQGGSGALFKLTAANGYGMTFVHDFNIFTDPAKSAPHRPFFFDATGDLYGTTEYAVYKLTPALGGFSETVLWFFDPQTSPPGGNTLYAPVIMDTQGHFWGTTLWGGQAGQFTGGIAWEVIP